MFEFLCNGPLYGTIRKTLPKRNTILCCRARFFESGKLSHRSGTGKLHINEGAIEDALYLLENNLRMRVSQVESLFNMSSSTIQRFIYNLLLLPQYYMPNIHETRSSVKIARIDFSRHSQNQQGGMYEY